MIKSGYIHLLATDAHNTYKRPPVLSQAVKELTRLVGKEQAQQMVTHLPEKIIQGIPCF